MKRVSAFEASDGEMFKSQDDCKKHEDKIRCHANAYGLATILLQEAPFSDDVRASVLYKDQDEETLAQIILNNLPEIRLFLATVDNRTAKNIDPAKKKKKVVQDIGVSDTGSKVKPVTKADLKVKKTKRKG